MISETNIKEIQRAMVLRSYTGSVGADWGRDSIKSENDRHIHFLSVQASAS